MPATGLSPADHQIIARLDRIPVWPWRRMVLAVIGAGFFFAFFDIITIGFALPKITAQFGVTAGQASWAITSGLIGYILGAIVDGRIADRFGRRLSLHLSVAAFSVGSLLSATSPDLGWLIFWRFISGMGIGAEIALVTTYIGELAPAPLRGRLTALAILFGFIGQAVVPFVALALVPGFEWGWRALFVLGALGGVVIFFMRRNIPPSLRWLVLHGRREEAAAALSQAESQAEKRLGKPLPEPVRVADHSPLADSPCQRKLWGRPYLSRLAILAVTWFCYYVGVYGWLTLAPDLLKQEGFPLRQDFFSLSLSGVGFVAGCLVAIALTDRIERKKVSAGGAVVWGIMLLVIGWFPSMWVVVAAGFLASFTIGLIIPVLYTYTGENFPTHSRGVAVAMSDGLGHLGGAFCGQIVFAAFAVWKFSGAFTVMGVSGFVAALLIMLGVAANGRSLDSL